jgi:hypothetical protein
MDKPALSRRATRGAAKPWSGSRVGVWAGVRISNQQLRIAPATLDHNVA